MIFLAWIISQAFLMWLAWASPMFLLNAYRRIMGRMFDHE